MIFKDVCMCRVEVGTIRLGRENNEEGRARRKEAGSGGGKYSGM